MVSTRLVQGRPVRLEPKIDAQRWWNQRHDRIFFIVGVFIGIVITWQTLQGAILANIKEFASLRALVSRWGACGSSHGIELWVVLRACC